MIVGEAFSVEEWEELSDESKRISAEVLFLGYKQKELENLQLLAALTALASVSKEAMSFCQTQKGMMSQDVAKNIGKPLLAAIRLIEANGGKV